MKHIIISLFSLLLLITSNNVSNNKSTFDTKDNLKQTQVLSRQNGIGSEYIDSNIEDTPYDGKQVSFTITVISDDSIINSNFLNDGMELLNQPIFNENKEATLNYNISKLQGSSNISISLSENNILSLNVYAICTEYGTFLNTDSYQMAEENYYAFLLLNEYITEEEYSDYINDFSSTTIIEDVSEVGNVDNHSNSEIKRRKIRPLMPMDIFSGLTMNIT